MPEYPDITVYIEALSTRVVGQPFDKIRLLSPFVVRTATPPISALVGRRVLALRRIGKRIVFSCESDLFLVVHLMIAGRFKWAARDSKVPGKIGLAAFDFPTGTLLLTEASSKKRASIHVVEGEAGLVEFQRGGLDVFGADLAAFRATLRKESHTLKRTLTDPRLLDGIGNAYSDEILHRARLSPVKLSVRLTAEESERLFHACRDVLAEWTERLRQETGAAFPEKVTAFREGMAVHGRYRKPCPVCGSAVQRIAYANNETNYCPICQTEGKLLADRALSRLMKGDWPRTLEELEEHKAARRESASPSGSTSSSATDTLSSAAAEPKPAEWTRSNDARTGNATDKTQSAAVLGRKRTANTKSATVSDPKAAYSGRSTSLVTPTEATATQSSVVATARVGARTPANDAESSIASPPLLPTPKSKRVGKAATRKRS